MSQNNLSAKILGLLYRALRSGVPIEVAATNVPTPTYNQPEESGVTRTIWSALVALWSKARAEDEKDRLERDAEQYSRARGEKFVPLGVNAEELVQLSSEHGVRGHFTIAECGLSVTPLKDSTPPPTKVVPSKLTAVEWGQLLGYVETVDVSSDVLLFLENGEIDVPLRATVLAAIGASEEKNPEMDFDLRLAAAIWTDHHGRNCSRCHLAASSAIHAFMAHAKTHGLPGWQQMIRPQDLGVGLGAIRAKKHPSFMAAAEPTCSWCRKQDMLVRVELLSGDFTIVESFCPYEAALLRRAHLRVAFPDRTPAAVHMIEQAIRAGKYRLPLGAQDAISGLADVARQEMSATVTREITCVDCQSKDVYLYILKKGEYPQNRCPDHAYLLAKKAGETMPRDEFIKLIVERELNGMAECKPVELFDGMWKVTPTPASEPLVVKSTPSPKVEVSKTLAPEGRPVPREPEVKPNGECPRCKSLGREANGDYRMRCEKEGYDFFGKWLCTACMNEIYPQVCGREGCDRHCWKQSYTVGAFELCGYCHKGLLDAGWNDETGEFEDKIDLNIRSWVRAFRRVLEAPKVPNRGTNGSKESKESEEVVASRDHFFCFGCTTTGGLKPASDLSVVVTKCADDNAYYALVDGQCRKILGDMVLDVLHESAETPEAAPHARRLHMAFLAADMRLQGNEALRWMPPVEPRVPKPGPERVTRGPNGHKLTKAARKAAAKRVAKGLPPFPTDEENPEPTPDVEISVVTTEGEEEAVKPVSDLTPRAGEVPWRAALAEMRTQLPETKAEPVAASPVVEPAPQAEPAEVMVRGDDDARLRGLTGIARTRVLKRLESERGKLAKN